LRGTIKFVDRRTGRWGIISVDGNRRNDVHFKIEDFVGKQPIGNDAGKEVEFELDVRGGRSARKISLIENVSASAVPATSLPTSVPLPLGLSEALKQWAYVPFTPITMWGVDYSSALDYLAKLALREKWHFGESPDTKNPYPILESYLSFTFFKLKSDSLVKEVVDNNGNRWATFNTGLVDKLYDPIYALFRGQKSPPWAFVDFCVPGKGDSGRRLTENFDPLPSHAKYFDKSFELVLDTSKEIYVDYQHVIVDGVARGRFPDAFLEEHVPKGFAWEDLHGKGSSERRSFLETLSVAIENDAQCMRRIKRRLEDAKLLAEKRVRWNFKTAVPIYNPRFNSLSLLLPLPLLSDEIVDISLVVTKNASGSYQGRTVFPLTWAYRNARLVCRPDSDWLTPETILVPERGEEELDEVEPDTAESNE